MLGYGGKPKLVLPLGHELYSHGEQPNQHSTENMRNSAGENRKKHHCYTLESDHNFQAVEYVSTLLQFRVSEEWGQSAGSLRESICLQESHLSFSKYEFVFLHQYIIFILWNACLTYTSIQCMIFHVCKYRQFYGYLPLRIQQYSTVQVLCKDVLVQQHKMKCAL
jgi:hypothetical protein